MELLKKLELPIEVIFGLLNLFLIFSGNADWINYVWLIMDVAAIIFYFIRKRFE